MLYTMILRNTKLFFKDKGMFFTALITPLVLLVLYVTFLGECLCRQLSEFDSGGNRRV